MQFTQDTMIASQMAIRNYTESVKPTVESLTSKNAQTGYVMGLLVAIVGTLDELGEDYNEIFSLASSMVAEAKEAIKQ